MLETCSSLILSPPGFNMFATHLPIH